MTSAALRRRWSTPEGIQLATKALTFLSQGDTAPSADVFGTFQGRVDLRGLTLEDPLVVKTLDVAGLTADVMEDFVELIGVHLTSIDLSYSRLRSFRLFDVEIEDCVFDQADCTDWRMWNTHVKDSSFQGTKMRGSALGAIADQGPPDEAALPSWTRVCFDGADLRDTSMGPGAVASCTFDGSKLDRASFENVNISDCLFTGTMKRTEFIGFPRGSDGSPRCKPMLRVDFGDARFDDVTFRGCRFEDVRFPEHQRLLIVQGVQAVAPQALALLVGDTRDERIARTVIENAGSPPDPHDSTAVFEASGEDDPVLDLIAWVLGQARATVPQ